MREERIIYIDPLTISREGFQRIIEAHNSSVGHEVVASVRSIHDLNRLAIEDLKPTVAVIGDMVGLEQGELSAKRLRETFPGITVVAFTLHGEKVPWADHTFDVLTPAKKVVSFFTNLEH
jgi:hypothetical protein